VHPETQIAMRVYVFALSFVVLLAAARTSGAALVAHWPFSEGTDTAVGDAYGGIDGAFGGDGTVGGQTWRHVTGLSVEDAPGTVVQVNGWDTLILGGYGGQRTRVQAGSPPAWSESIPIANHSFESPVEARGGLNIDVWTNSGSGVFRGAGDFGQGAAPTHGVQMAFLNEGNGQIFQTIAKDYEAGRHYSLLVDVSARAPQIAADDFLMALYSGAIGNLSDLNSANTVRAGSYRMATGVTNDAFRTMVLSVTADQVAAAGAAGQPIGIGFFGNGSSGQGDCTISHAPKRTLKR
jgi:hypothetical protein